MKIGRSEKNTAVFSIVAADAPTKPFQGNSFSKVCNQVMDRVHETNKHLFATRGDLLNGAQVGATQIGACPCWWYYIPLTQFLIYFYIFQFFGFRLDDIRKALEMSPGAVACAAPLTTKS